LFGIVGVPFRTGDLFLLHFGGSGEDSREFVNGRLLAISLCVSAKNAVEAIVAAKP
jgi:hypothetical protein